MVLVRAAENEMLLPHTGLQVQPHKDHKYIDLFPSEIVADRGRHGDMLRLTEVALLCAAPEPDRRPKVQDVVRMIDEIAAADGPELAGR